MRNPSSSASLALAVVALVLSIVSIAANLRTEATARAAYNNVEQLMARMQEMGASLQDLKPHMGYAEGAVVQSVAAAPEPAPKPPVPANPARPPAPKIEKAAAQDQPLQELKLQLPKPLFTGTPRGIVSRNLDKNTNSRAPFFAPAGVKNLALHKPVTASDSSPVIGELEMITDGDKEGADGSFVEFGPGVQWVQVDLGAPHELYAILFWHFHSMARAYHDVIVQCGDDPDFVTGVTTLFNNDDDNSAGLGIGVDMEYIDTHEGKLVDAKGASARYVRIYSNGNTANDMNQMIEIEVYGKP